jgi:arabinogalactan endo-1,4-beta-galactosidase
MLMAIIANFIKKIKEEETMSQARQEKRRKERAEEKRTKVYSYTREQLQAYIKRQVDGQMNRVMSETIANCMAVTIKVLHEENGLGKTRIQRFVTEYNRTFDEIVQNKQDLNTIRKLSAKMGVNIYPKERVVN